MDYSRMIAVTNRHVFDDKEEPETAFLCQMAKLAGLRLKAVVLREKDLDEESYTLLAEKILMLGTEGSPVVCQDSAGTAAYFKKHLVIHKYPEAALKLGIPRIHLPLSMLTELHNGKPETLRAFEVIGTSVHSVEDAREAVRCGADYLFAGNVWETTCKPGLSGRGLQYLQEVSESVEIPVFGIGGISEERMPEVLKTGAAGGCMMSGFMQF